MSANGSMNLLIVEDDPDFRETCARWMTRKGHRVAAAANGHEALAVCEQRLFDVAIVDMNMPGLTGLEVLDRVKASQAETEVIILTGQGTVESAVNAMKLGACDYLTKPFPLDELEQRCLRADKPFVTINCAALPEQLVESELFGHRKGAFTGANEDRAGLFEVADGGTLFVDEIGELPGSLQPKLLRALEDGSIRRVGSHRERRVDVRLIAATNRTLIDEVAAGRFREDLYYRINVMSLELPPLRKRHGDVALLIQTFMGKDWTITDKAKGVMESYQWPGNVQQLKNAIERAQILADHQTITIDDLPREVTVDCDLALPNGTAKTPPSTPKNDGVISTASASPMLADLERAHIADVQA